MKTLTGIIIIVTALLGTSTQAAEPSLSVETKIPLGDVKGRIDHLALDVGRKRLYIAELGNDSVGVVDLAQLKVLRTITGLKEPQGIAYVSSVDRIYVANGGDGSTRLFKANDFSDAGKINLGDDADNIRVDSRENRVYVGYGSGALAVIDPDRATKLDDIPLKGHPESFQLERNGTRIFVNIPDSHSIEVIDRSNRNSRRSLPLQSARANFPMALDEASHRFFVVFRQPAQLAMFDSNSGSLTASTASCGDADDVFVDSKRRRIYVACGEGSIDTFEERDEKLTRVARLTTAPGARTALYSDDLDRLFLAVRAGSSMPAAVWVIRPTSQAELANAQVLFVCEHGNVKSLLAASYFNQQAQARGLKLHAVSRGSAPDSDTVPLPIVQGLARDGVDVATFHPEAVTASDVSASQRIITIGTSLPASASARATALEQWNDVPAASTDFQAARAALQAHVARLIDQLDRSQPK
jgi:YVTN family beta-propeller protein